MLLMMLNPLNPSATRSLNSVFTTAYIELKLYELEVLGVALCGLELCFYQMCVGA